MPRIVLYFPVRFISIFFAVFAEKRELKQETVIRGRLFWLTQPGFLILWCVLIHYFSSFCFARSFCVSFCQENRYITMNGDESTSATLIGQLWDAQNIDAWRRFVDRYRPVILSRCGKRGMDSHDAEEITQQVLMKLARLMPSFQYDSKRSFRGWLGKVVDREIIDMWRAASKRVDTKAAGVRSLDDLGEAAVRGGQPLQDALYDAIDSDLQLLRNAMELVRQRVEKSTWQIFEQRKIEGMPAKEVAQQLGVKVAAVHKAASRVFKMLTQEVSMLRPDENE